MIVAIGVVLGIFTGVWGGIVWIVVAGIVLAAVLAVGARNRTLRTANPSPSGTPRGQPASPGTANERVGQS